ncbi:winged helix DNA-binding domain-containing protein [Catenulispora yoronensis]|uniref:Winged helix DNA-binding domain-containing protein n=1 Tax=Catenulispora yoronensis TaxID=450799 RepID=A0ABP5GJP9_9ACTN
MRKLNANQIRWLRVRAQGLAGGPETAASTAGAVRVAAALQAQAPAPVRAQVWSRSDGLRPADVDAAFAGPSPSAVRSWLMRGTLHAVLAEDLRPLLAVLGPVNLRAGQRRRDQLGLTDELCARALAALPGILGGGRALTRAELVRQLAGHGVALDLKTQQPPHLLAFAANSALICRGPDAGRDEPTYVLIDEWLDRPEKISDHHDALGFLARRYFAAYGPATTVDLVAWSGLPAAEARKAVELIRDDLEEVDHDGARLLLSRGTAEPAPPERPHRLLGRFDPYLLGHRSRALILDPAFAKRVNSGGGMIAQTLISEGRIVGTWNAQGLEPFADLPAKASEAFRKEADDYLMWSKSGI